MDFGSIFMSGAVAAAMFAGIGWLCREWITARLSKGIQHEYDAKLEALRADLRSKDAQITALREGALFGASARQTALFQRKIEAVDAVWADMAKLSRLNFAVLYTSLDYPTVKDTARSEGGRSLLKAMDEADLINSLRASTYEPYVPQYAWALFQAYQGIMLFTSVKVKALGTGDNIKDMFESAAVLEVLRKTLPDQSALIDERGQSVTWHLMSVLRERVLDALRSVLAGKDDDAATVERAAAIIRSAESLNAAIVTPR